MVHRILYIKPLIIWLWVYIYFSRVSNKCLITSLLCLKHFVIQSSIFIFDDKVVLLTINKYERLAIGVVLVAAHVDGYLMFGYGLERWYSLYIFFCFCAGSIPTAVIVEFFFMKISYNPKYFWLGFFARPY